MGSLAAFPVPRVDESLLKRSQRPITGWLVLAGMALGPGVLMLAVLPLLMVLLSVLVGVGLVVATWAAVGLRLRQFGASVDRATPEQAPSLLAALGARRDIRLFARHGWTAYQTARLEMLAGRGQPAATAFAECARLCGATDHPQLLAAQARALLQADDRLRAIGLFDRALAQGPLDAGAQLDFAVALLPESARRGEVRQRLDGARSELETHPRWMAAAALLAHRDGDEAASLERFEPLRAGSDDDLDPQTAALVKRTRKALRPALKRSRRA